MKVDPRIACSGAQLMPTTRPEVQAEISLHRYPEIRATLPPFYPLCSAVIHSYTQVIHRVLGGFAVND